MKKRRLPFWLAPLCLAFFPVSLPAATDPMDSPFGVFAAFSAEEQGYFKQQLGWDNSQYFAWAQAHIQTLNVHWTRSNMQLIWDLVEPVAGSGVYNWENEKLTDPIILQIYSAENEVHWLGVFHAGSGPASVTSPAHPLMLRNPLDDPANYQSFVRAVVERYDGDGYNDAAANVAVKYWQLGNEMPDWANSGRTLAEYVTFVRLIRLAARQADPESKFVLMAPTQGFTPDTDLVQVMQTLAAAHEFDAIDVHHWSVAENWKMTAVPLYRQWLDDHGLADVQIWGCENGTWEGEPFGEPCQTERQQAASLVKRYVGNMANGLDKLMWNNLMDFHDFAGNSGSAFNSMALISDGEGPGEDPAMFNEKRLAFFTYQKMTEMLAGADVKAVECVHNDGTVYIYKIPPETTPLWVAWNDGAAPADAAFSGLPIGKIQINPAVPSAASGKDVGDFASAFASQILETTDGTLVYSLGDAPVYLQAYTEPTPTPSATPAPGASSPLVPAYPNPADGRVTFHWSESDPASARISIYNASGERIAQLSAVSPGEKMVWNTREVPAGVYFYRIFLSCQGREDRLPAGKIAIVH